MAPTLLYEETQFQNEKLHEMKKSDGAQWEQAKADLETRIAELEDSLKEIGSKASAN